MPYVSSRPLPASSCNTPLVTTRFYREHRYHRQQLEPKPCSPSSSSSSSSPYSSFIASNEQPQLTIRPKPHSSNDSSTGVLLSAIRSLSRRGRFPSNGDRLPLSMTNEMAHYISFRIDDANKTVLSGSTLGFVSSSYSDYRRRVKVIMVCFNTKTDTTPIFEIPLTGAMMVARTCSESGPCLYIMANTGTFEFQCPLSGPYDYIFWEAQMRYLGVKIILPQDLFATTNNDLIGEGSFAQVYLVTHKATERNVVVKRIPKSKCQASPDCTSSAHIEIQVLRLLHHPYIVQFQAAFEDDLFYFIVLERLAGGTVDSWLRTHRAYTEQEARGAMFRMLSALATLEKENIVHRDFKPENVLLENSDPTSVKLIDFGLAAFLNTPRMSMHCGSPGFVAPEIIAKKKSYGCRADMFSAGVFLYSILSGKFPFHCDGDPQSRRLAQNEHCQISLTSPLWQSTSKDAKDLILKLLTKDPATRLSAGQSLTHKWMVGRIPECIHSRPNYDGISMSLQQSLPYGTSHNPLIHTESVFPGKDGLLSNVSNSRYHAVVNRLALLGNSIANTPSSLVDHYSSLKIQLHEMFNHQSLNQLCPLTNISNDEGGCNNSTTVELQPVTDSRWWGSGSSDSSTSRSTSVRNSISEDNRHYCQKLCLSPNVWHSDDFSVVPPGLLLTIIG